MLAFREAQHTVEQLNLVVRTTRVVAVIDYWLLVKRTIGCDLLPHAHLFKLRDRRTSLNHIII